MKNFSIQSLAQTMVLLVMLCAAVSTKAVPPERAVLQRLQNVTEVVRSKHLSGEVQQVNSTTIYPTFLCLAELSLNKANITKTEEVAELIRLLQSYKTLTNSQCTQNSSELGLLKKLLDDLAPFIKIALNNSKMP